MAKVRDYHAVLDVFVVPRTPDRVCQLVTPLKPVEAMASGLPVVVSGVRALGEIVHDKVTGLLFPPLDADALADALQLLLGNPELRRRTGRQREAMGGPRPHLGAQRGPVPRRVRPPRRALITYHEGSSREEVSTVNVVIIGLGYVGLPLAQEAVRVGLHVTGLDIKQATVDGLNAGRSHVDDLSDADIEAMVAGGFRAVTDIAEIAAPARTSPSSASRPRCRSPTART